MKGINHLFESIKSKTIQEVKRRSYISQLIKKEIGQEIPIENIHFKEGVLFIKTSSVIQNQIFIKKKHLISLVSKMIDIVDIR
jgi:hypothetical protein